MEQTLASLLTLHILTKQNILERMQHRMGVYPEQLYFEFTQV